MLRLCRVLFSSVFYPANYGFITQTLGEDHASLDLPVLSHIEVEPLCIISARVIGVMRMIDSDEAHESYLIIAPPIFRTGVIQSYMLTGAKPTVWKHIIPMLMNNRCTYPHLVCPQFLHFRQPSS